jgi:hypothetical protein
MTRWNDDIYSTTDGVLLEPQMVFVEYDEYVSNPFDGQNSTVQKQEEQPVVWAITSTTQARFVHGGVVFKVSDEYQDRRYLGSSVDAILEYVDRVIEKLSITADSTLSIEVFTWLTATPTLGVPQKDDRIFQEYETGERWGSLIVRRFPKRTRYVPKDCLVEAIDMPEQLLFTTEQTTEQREAAIQSHKEALADTDELNTIIPHKLFKR